MKRFFELFNNLKLGYIYRRTMIMVSFNNDIFLLVKLFYENGLIRGYSIKEFKKNIKIIVYLKYVKGRPFFSGIQQVRYYKGKPFFYNKIYYKKYILNNGYFLIRNFRGNFEISGISNSSDTLVSQGGILLGKIIFR